MMLSLILFFFLFSQAVFVNSYTIYSTNILAREKNTIDSKIPVILLHGINNLPRTFRVLKETILKQDSQRPVYELHTHYDGVPGSWESLHVFVSPFVLFAFTFSSRIFLSLSHPKGTLRFASWLLTSYNFL